MRVWALVPPLVVRRAPQPVVARKVDDDPGAVGELVVAVRAVRERQEEDVASADLLVRHEREVGPLAQIRMGDRDRLPRERRARRRDLADLRMRQEHAQQLAAGVAAGADDRDRYHVAALTVAALATSST